MPRKGDKITHQEERVIQGATTARTPQELNKFAGYSETGNGAYKALARPAVQAEIIKRQLERISGELLPLAVDVHIKLLMDDRTPAGARVQAVKLAYDRAFGEGAGDKLKEPHEMTAEEIASAINQLESVAASRAKTVESAPTAPNVLD